MIDEMVVLLGKEQQDGGDKKAYCEAELEKSEDKLKMLIAKLTKEIKAPTAGIIALDKAVAEATE
eukprot:5459430-Heterocapsa_arctica.AAC.1